MRVATSLAGLLAAALIAAGCGGGGMSSPPSVPQTSPQPTPRPTSGHGLRGHFHHVIVMVQENRTVDNLFNGFPGADTVTAGSQYGEKVALQPVPLQPQLTVGHDLDHGHKGFALDFDGGLMDGFNHEFTPPNQGNAYAYVRHSDVQNYWTLASRFTLADEVFQANQGPSFPAHIAVIAAQTGYPFAVDSNPNDDGGPPGCFGTDRVGYVDMRTSFPGTPSQGLACAEMPTIFDLLDAKRVSWRYYAPNYGIGIHYWTGPDYVRHLAFGPDHAKVINPETRVLDDIAGRSLPAVSYVIPQSCMSDHPRHSSIFPLGGPKWIAEIANAIGVSPYWKDTLILVTWDDWGGWYDHVAPPILNADQLGFRTPLLIISAYPASAGVPDHTMRNQASIVTAIESAFGLPSLGQLDARTDDLSGAFDFGNAVNYGAPLPSETPPSQQLCNFETE